MADPARPSVRYSRPPRGGVVFGNGRNPLRLPPGIPGPALLLAAAVLASGCVSHLQQAKAAYTRGEEHTRAYRVAEARGAYLRAFEEAEWEARRRPSAQAFLIKGLAELRLERWSSASASFRGAFSLGFEKGEEWAEELALYGLAMTLLETGMERSAEDFLARLVDKSRTRPILRLAARSYAELALARAAADEVKARDRRLQALLKTAERLIERDPACGYHRYLLSQVQAHLADDRASFEAAVLAKELGLPTLELSRDNDNQIVFCYRRLAAVLTGKARVDFLSRYRKWVERWEWPGPETPDWRNR